MLCSAESIILQYYITSFVELSFSPTNVHSLITIYTFNYTSFEEMLIERVYPFIEAQKRRHVQDKYKTYAPAASRLFGLCRSTTIKIYGYLLDAT